MTVLENVMEAPVQVLGLSKSVAKERAILYLDKVGIDERARAKYPVHLSGAATACFYCTSTGHGTRCIAV